VAPSSLVPGSTDWFVRASSAYPLGPLKFSPAKKGGLVLTFQHQSFNGLGSNELPWRTGSLCLDTPARVLGRRAFDIEPYQPEKRLRWHVLRALRWLEAASCGELALADDPFELAEFPLDQTFLLSVAFSESHESFLKWKETSQRVGIAELYDFDAKWNTYVVKSFHALDGRRLFMPEWGPSITNSSTAISRGYWWRLKGPPVIDPWQAPTSWGELRTASRTQGIDLDELLRQAFRSRKTKDNVGRVGLIGFPVPARIGEAPDRMHWQALRLPELATSDGQVHGFRSGSNSAWQHNREVVLRDEAVTKWAKSENWYADQLQTRGVLPLTVTAKKCLFLGAGALGSSLAELLVRAGLLRMLLVDEDRLEAGNLVRHTLDLRDLNEFKAEAVAKRLNLLSPSARIEGLNSSFPPDGISDKNRIAACDLVIDCTGDDEVLYHLSTLEWANKTLFFSVSFGLRAHRLFCFAARAVRFPNESFRELLTPWLARDVEEHAGEEIPREGIGCWHPVFPARADDVWMMASVATKQLERFAGSALERSELVVFEQCRDEDGSFAGIRRASVQVGDE